MKKRTINELRQVKDSVYNHPYDSEKKKKKSDGEKDKNDERT